VVFGSRSKWGKTILAAFLVLLINLEFLSGCVLGRNFWVGQLKLKMLSCQCFFDIIFLEKGKETALFAPKKKK
jgi:hypothetical protein